jgi:Glucan phosphorylase
MTDIHDGATLREALAEIASNFSFSWTPGARALFADLAPQRFWTLGHNPTALLSELTDDDLERALTSEYAVHLGRVQERLSVERERRTWWQTQAA